MASAFWPGPSSEHLDLKERSPDGSKLLMKIARDLAALEQFRNGCTHTLDGFGRSGNCACCSP
ncbi:hypothetical protein [Rhizobium leguminosarum]|uniref:hypothetical protein n=1 Tax=Rhizobium leguminosarum TaxID=384 RepID=UPI001FEE4B71|nr:hypothetical protein [Rhizobium leguminosarum]